MRGQTFQHSKIFWQNIHQQTTINSARLERNMRGQTFQHSKFFGQIIQHSNFLLTSEET